MNKRFTIFMLLMALFVPWTAKAQETKTIQVAPDRSGNRGTMTVYKRVTSLTSGRNYLIVNSATANSDALALSQVSSTASTITASFVHINSGISATGNAAYISDLSDPTAVWTATSSGSGWRFSHYNNGSTYYIYANDIDLSASTSSLDWTYSGNSLSYSSGFWIFSTTYYITTNTSGFSLGTSSAYVYLFEETSMTAYDVTAEVSPAGIGRVTGAGQYPAGATCTLEASTLHSEYAFSNWTMNGAVVSTNPTYTFTVNDDQNVVANFESTVNCPSPSNLTAGTPYAHSVPLSWTSTADNFNVRYRTIGSGETQTFFDGFENGLGNWTVIRNGDGTTATDWSQSNASSWGSPHSGTYVAQTRSWNNSAYSVDNWLITPQVTLDGVLKFWVLDDGTWHEHYDVYVSTTGNSIADFSLYYEPGDASDTWTQVTVDLSSFNGARGYIALRHTDTDKNWMFVDDFGIYAQRYGEWSELIPVDETSFNLTGLESQTTYQVQVQANCGDELSGWSNRVNFTTSAPSTAAPTNLTVDVNSITNSSATVNWQGVAANDNHQYYQVYYAESNVTSVPYSPAAPNLIDSITETSYTLAGLTPDTEYHVWVRDYCGEDGYSNWTPYITFSTLVSCPCPTQLTARDITAHGATIEWTSIGDSHQYYQMYYADNTVTIVPDSIAAPNLIDSISETSYSLSGLTSETEYHVWVRAYCGEYDGYSVWTPYQSFTTLESCPSPTDLTVSDVTAHGATIEWNGTNDSYLVMVSESEQGTTTYSYDFEDGTSQGWTLLKGNEGTSPNNWMHISEYSYAYNYEAMSSGHGHNGSDGYMYSESYISGASEGSGTAVYPDNYLVSPQIALGGSITFHAGAQNVSYCAEHFSLMVSTTGNDAINNFTTVQTWTFTPTASSGNEWQEFTVDLSAYSGLGYVAIRHFDCYDQWFLCIDDITIENGSSETTWMTYEAEESPFVLYDAENIHPESTYNVQVIGICGDEESRPSTTTSFTTTIACPAPTNLAVVESSVTGHDATVTWNGTSEDYNVYLGTVGTPADLMNVNFSNGIPNNWNNSSSYPWTVTNGYIKSGNAGVAGSTSSISVTVTFPADGTIEFDAECMGEGTSTYWDHCDFLIDDATQLNAGANISGWNHYTYEVTAGQHTFTWSYTKDSSVNPTGDYFAIDNVVMSSSSITWSDPIHAEDTEYTFYGLASETTYFVKVQSDCGDDGVSSESNSVTFTTLVSCPAPIPLDPTDVTSSSAVLNWDSDAESYNVSYYKTFFFDSFEEDLSQWTIYHEGDPESWEWAIENPHDNSSELNAHSGLFAAVAYCNTDVHDDSWLVTPQILLPSQTTLKFWVMRSTYDDAQDEYEVRLSTSGNAIEDFDDIILKPKTVANSTWTEEVIDLSEYDGQQVYIAIRHDYTDGFFLMVDDFGIFGWSEPIATTDNSLAIEDLLPETEYQWQVQANCGDEDGLSRWSEISTFTTLRACPVPFYLEAYDETAYGATIAWTGYSDSYIVMVKEDEDEEALSYSYDFEDGTLQGWTILKGTTGNSPNNWMHVSAYPTSANDISNGYGHNSSDGFMLSESYIYGETQSSGTAVTPDNYLISPQVWLGGSITFYAGTPNASFSAEKFSVMVSTTGNEAVSDFTTVQTWTFTTTETSGTAWKQYTVDLSDFSGKGYIAIRHFDCSDQWLLCIDDVTIESGPVIPTWFTYESEASPFVLYDPEHLSAETTYLVKVKGFCDDEATDFSNSITFTTLDENTKVFVFEGDWSDDNNWAPAGVPSIEQNVILRAEATVFDVAEANAITIDNAGMLTIEDGGQLKTNTDVEATMKKFIIGYGTDYVETNDGYYLMTLPTVAPISAADAGLLTEESEYDLYSWDRTATDEEWHNNHDSLDIENGMGFLYANQDDMEMSFTATLHNSSEPIVVTPAYDEVEHGGWNLYGNPFPCEVYITTEAEGMTFYRLIGNELVPIDWAIAPMEAFFVKATAAGQTFTISREAPEEFKTLTNGNTNRLKVRFVAK